MSIKSILLSTQSLPIEQSKKKTEEFLTTIFPNTQWGIDTNFVPYTDDNKKSIWTHELRSIVKNSLQSNKKSENDYAEWLGDIYYSYVSVYPKSLFPKYRSNAGWRIVLLSIPRAEVVAIGIASHYQNAQNHKNLGLVSNFFFEFTQNALKEKGELSFTPRKITADDWDRDGLFTSKITKIAGIDIQKNIPQGLLIKDFRNTTLKKILASFIAIKILPADFTDTDLKGELAKAAKAGEVLTSSVYPYQTIEDFESLRALALQDMANAQTRISLRKRSATRSIVRVYYGPPGTGKTLTAVREAVKIVAPSTEGEHDPQVCFRLFNQLHEQCAFITFHPSLQYEDLVESIRPVLSFPEHFDIEDGDAKDLAQADISGHLQYIIHEGLLLRMIRRALKAPHKEFVIVIDEINRGDISRILGPLLSALEPDKRVGAEFPVGFELQYPLAQELESRLFMPSNLHVLGTMNSSDRNIALVDHALRRRFDFIEVPPDTAILTNTEDFPPIDCKKLLETLNIRITRLLGNDYCIGHGYFSYCKRNIHVIENMAKKIIPLLRECFYGNEGLIFLVLGDNKDQKYNFFKIIEEEDDFQKNFSVSQDIAESMGYQPYSRPRNIQFDQRFWNPHLLIPAPLDEAYAVQCLLKLTSTIES